MKSLLELRNSCTDLYLLFILHNYLGGALDSIQDHLEKSEGPEKFNIGKKNTYSKQNSEEVIEDEENDDVDEFFAVNQERLSSLSCVS